MRLTFVILLSIFVRGALSVPIKGEISIVPGAPREIAPGVRVKLERSGSVNGIPGSPKVVVGGETIELLDPVTVTSHGQLVTIHPPGGKRCDTAPVLRGHMLSSVVTACRVKFEVARDKAPRVPMENLNGNVTFPVELPMFYSPLNGSGRGTSRLWKLAGQGAHFLALRMLDAQVYINAYTGKKCAEAELQLVTSFGAGRAKVTCTKGAEVSIGPESYHVGAFLIERDRPEGADKLSISVSGGTPGGELHEALVASYGGG